MTPQKINQLNLECGTLCIAYDLLLIEIQLLSFSLLPLFWEHIKRTKAFWGGGYLPLLLEACGKKIKKTFVPGIEPGLSCISSGLSCICQFSFCQGPLFRKKGTFVSLLLKNIILSLILLLIVIYMMPWQEAQNGQRINGLWYPNPTLSSKTFHGYKQNKHLLTYYPYSVSDA